MAAGLHHLRHAELAWVLGLQMRRDEADALLEALKRHTARHARALDQSPGGDAVVAIQRAQQSGLARAVVPVHEPPLPGVHGK